MEMEGPGNDDNGGKHRSTFTLTFATLQHSRLFKSAGGAGQLGRTDGEASATRISDRPSQRHLVLDLLHSLAVNVSSSLPVVTNSPGE